MKKILTMLMVVSMYFTIQATTVSAGTALLGWDLVDSGKHLDWDGSTGIQTQFNSAVTTWNNYKSGVIRPDDIFVIQDVAVSDWTESGGYAGLTSPSGTLKFNTVYFSTHTSNWKLNLCLHELGHALGLAHNTSVDVIYEFVTENTILSSNDKASYDLVYTTVY